MFEVDAKAVLPPVDPHVDQARRQRGLRSAHCLGRRHSVSVPANTVGSSSGWRGSCRPPLDGAEEAEEGGQPPRVHVVHRAGIGPPPRRHGRARPGVARPSTPALPAPQPERRRLVGRVRGRRHREAARRARRRLRLRADPRRLGGLAQRRPAGDAAARQRGPARGLRRAAAPLVGEPHFGRVGAAAARGRQVAPLERAAAAAARAHPRGAEHSAQRDVRPHVARHGPAGRGGRARALGAGRQPAGAAHARLLGDPRALPARLVQPHALGGRRHRLQRPHGARRRPLPTRCARGARHCELPAADGPARRGADGGARPARHRRALGAGAAADGL